MIDESSINSFLDKALVDDSPHEYSEEELLSFLDEIENDDVDLAKAEIDSIESIEDDKPDEEINQVVDEIEHDNEGWYTKNGIRLEPYQKHLLKGQEQLRNSLKEWRIKREQRRLDISRWAFDQSILPLNEQMTIERKRLMIELLTRPMRDLITKYEAYINNRVTKLLLPVIPVSLKLAKMKWPWVFIANPGFMYKTHTKKEEPKTFWVTPNVPYYFKQGTEQSILEERDASMEYDFISGLDRAVNRWYSARTNLARREVKYASKFINIKGNTYYHLLLLDPLWFEKLYNEIKEQKS